MNVQAEALGSRMDPGIVILLYYIPYYCLCYKYNTYSF